MKNLSLMLMLLAGTVFNTQAQQKKIEKAVISTPTIQCGMCKSKIEKYLSREYGINSVKVDVKKKTTTVSWMTDRTNIENIKTAIANTGYDAGDVTAEESAYKRLPTCCKKPEDQGDTPGKMEHK